MGYDTQYTLRFPVTDQWDKIGDEIEESFLPFNRTGYSTCNNACPWYQHEIDMRNFSTKFPDVVFDLYGEGEERGDVWHKYFKNGKMQVAKATIEISFDPFDESQLK